jgi:exonuclease III
MLPQNVALIASVLSNISFGIQNCNSLNISTNCPKQVKKVKAITNLDCDFIFLSDLRLSNKHDPRDLERSFLSSGNKSYTFTHHSTKNSRGVGILINSKLDISINHTYKDNEENVLGLNLSIYGCTINIVSIYGPNRDGGHFFRDITRFLQLYPDCPTVIGGDWNATFSTSNTENNIDIFRMANPPSALRSAGISELCESFNLTDPFRVLHPSLRDFTFKPRTGRFNRSRLDFFLISDNLLESLSSCDINNALATELFRPQVC